MPDSLTSSSYPGLVIFLNTQTEGPPTSMAHLGTFAGLLFSPLSLFPVSTLLGPHWNASP